MCQWIPHRKENGGGEAKEETDLCLCHLGMYTLRFWVTNEGFSRIWGLQCWTEKVPGQLGQAGHPRNGKNPHTSPCNMDYMMIWSFDDFKIIKMQDELSLPYNFSHFRISAFNSFPLTKISCTFADIYSHIHTFLHSITRLFFSVYWFH